MPTSVKLEDLRIDETSGVDHPAHLHEGWLVMKSDDTLEGALALAEEGIPSIQPGESTVELTVETDQAPEVEEETALEPVTTSVDELGGTEVHKELTDLRKQLDDARQAHDALVEERDLEKAVVACHQWAILPELNPQEFAPVLRSIRATDPEGAERVEAILTASATALGESGILKEIGTDAASESDDAYALIEARAKELLTSGEVGSLAKGITQVAESDPELYQRYMTEKGF